MIDQLEEEALQVISPDMITPTIIDPRLAYSIAKITGSVETLVEYDEVLTLCQQAQAICRSFQEEEVKEIPESNFISKLLEDKDQKKQLKEHKLYKNN